MPLKKEIEPEGLGNYIEMVHAHESMQISYKAYTLAGLYNVEKKYTL